MALEGTYEPSPWDWVRDQIELYESSKGAEGTELEGKPCVILWTRGRRSGTIRKSALMRVADEQGNYAVVASMGGAPKHPVWYHNLTADPSAVTIQDGPAPFDAHVREITGEERAEWWERCVAAFPPYAEYQQKTSRIIPVLIAAAR